MRPSPRSLMEFAEWRLIIVSHSKCPTGHRLSHSRSYLSCHHIVIACAIGGVTSFRQPIVDSSSRARRLVICLIFAAMSQQGPDDAGIAVRPRHGGDVLVAPLE